MAQTRRIRPRRTVAAGDQVTITKQVVTPDALEDGGKLYPARGLPGGSVILPDEERPDVPEVVLTELGLTVRKQIRADAESLFFFVRLPKALGEKLTGLSKEIAEGAGVEPEEADHVTVLYLQSSNGAISEELAGTAVKAARKALEGVAPLNGALQGWGYFDGAKKGGKGHTALVALLDCPGLAEAHVALKEAMEGLGLPVEAQTHGYVPHATVAYLDAGSRVDNLPPLGDKLEIGELELMHTEAHVLKLSGEEKIEKRSKPFSSPGGKDHLVPKLLTRIPEHQVYVEPYAGSASLFFAKEPSEKEILADVNQDIIDTFTFLKTGSDADFEWIRTQKWKWSKEQFGKLLESKPEGLRERAYRFKYLNLFSQRGRGRKIDDSERAKSYSAKLFLSNLEKFRDRLKNVALLCKDALAVMKAQDGKGVFFYLDPPWKPESANEEWKNFDGGAFQDACKGLKGKVLISYQGDLELGDAWAEEKISSTQGGIAGTSTQKLYRNFKADTRDKIAKIKALTLAPDTDPSDLSNKDLVQAHWQLHLLFRDEKARKAAKFSTEDMANLHALVVDELFDRGRKHPAPPDEGLDDVSADFERHVEEQPDWTEASEKREEGEVTDLPTRPVEKQADPYMEVPPEEKAPYRYTVQQHFRGKSVHSDFRIGFRPGKLLIGWTLLTGIADAVKASVVTLGQARALGRARLRAATHWANDLEHAPANGCGRGAGRGRSVVRVGRHCHPRRVAGRLFRRAQLWTLR
ncbi:hypothetical protein LCGC14_1622430 [marine sediment metagenome]|uniref:site-specific DNA-methyltransferase (adenine-specific) n=1 Tax=marine sediment metagenome TaxID=412755 RepID=A0A0F9IS41_9ZZZZ